MEYKMKNILQIILISFFAFTVISCAKESGSSSSSTATTMSTPTIADGNYKLSAVSVAIYYSSGSYYGSATYTINHDTSVNLVIQVTEWHGKGQVFTGLQFLESQHGYQVEV